MYRLILSFVLACLLSSGVLAQETLAIVGDHNAKPKNWLSESGEPRGIMIDLLNEISTRTGIKFTYELVPWKRAFAISEKGRAAIIGFSKTAERQMKWHYSEPMYFDELVLVTKRENKFDYTGMESLRYRKIGIKLGASYGDDFEQARQKGVFQVTETPSRANQLQMLAANRIDVVLVSPGKIALEATLAENDWLNAHSDDFVVLAPPFKLDPNYLGVPKSMNKEKLLDRINKELKALFEDGTQQRIVDKNVELVLESLRSK